MIEQGEYAVQHTPQQRKVSVLTDLLGSGLVNGQITWRPFREPGREAVDVHWLYTSEETGQDGAEAYISNQLPGSHTNLHHHLGFELLFVLEGELFDDRGEQYLPGTLIVQRPGSIHRVASVTGCKLLVVRQKGTVSLH